MARSRAFCHFQIISEFSLEVLHLVCLFFPLFLDRFFLFFFFLYSFFLISFVFKNLLDFVELPSIIVESPHYC
jgi:hypothetical protein